MSTIDDEFDKIIAGLHGDIDSDIHRDASNAVDADHDAVRDPSQTVSAGGMADMGGDEVTTSPSAVTGVGLVLCPIASASALCSMLGLYTIERWVVPMSGQVALWLPLDDCEESGFDELLGDERPIPEECDAYARVLSRLTRFGAVAVASKICDDTHEIQGSVVARRYVNGEPEETIPAGLLISSIDSRAEELLLGHTVAADYPDAVHPRQRPQPFKRGFGRPFGPRH